MRRGRDPGAVERVAELRADLALGLAEARPPVFEGPCVVQAQILEMVDRLVRRLEHVVHDLPHGRSIRSGKDSASGPRIQRPGTIAADEVEKPASRLRLQHTLDGRAERRKVSAADVFQHADRYEDIEVTGDIAIVVLDEFDAIEELFRGGAFAGKADLLARDVERLDPCPVMSGHVQRQRAPAAAGLDDRVPRLQLQLAAHQIELGDLRCLERRFRRVEQRAGVDELAIQPQLIEIIPEVVVVVHVATGQAKAVGTRDQQRQPLANRQAIAARQAARRLHDPREPPSNVDPTLGIELAELQIRIGDQFQQRFAIPYHHVAHRGGSRLPGGRPVPQFQAQVGRPQPSLKRVGDLTINPGDPMCSAARECGPTPPVGTLSQR